VVGPSVAERWLLLVGGPVILLAIGLVVPPSARALLSWEHALPFRPVIRFLGAVDQPWEIAVNALIWAVVGLLIAFEAISDQVTLVVTDSEATITDDTGSRTVRRAEASTVHVDGGELVVLGRDSRQLLRETLPGRADVVGEAFRRHGYTWSPKDPHQGLYTSWTGGSGDLPDAVDAVLRARQDALDAKSKQQVGQLRVAVEELGYTVRDEGGRQFWRPLVRS